MKLIYSGLLALLLAGCGQLTTEELVSQVKDGTVLIANQKDVSSGGTGTGFIIDNNTIITNNHVIDGTNNVISVYSPESSKKYAAEVLYKDPIADLAIVQLKDWNTYQAEQKPVILKLGNSDDAKAGSKVVVIGHPWGLTWSVSEGIISAKNRRAGANPKYLDQIDAYVYPGNSGGPVFNQHGEVICVNEIMYKGESGGGSYGMCIPSNLVKKVVHDMQTLKEVRWRVVNVSIGLTEDGASVIVNNVEPNGAADKAGITAGDLILEIYTPDNHPRGMKVNKPDELITEMAAMHGDDEDIKLLIQRGSEKMMVDVKTNYRLSKEYAPDKAK